MASANLEVTFRMDEKRFRRLMSAMERIPHLSGCPAYVCQECRRPHLASVHSVRMMKTYHEHQPAGLCTCYYRKELAEAVVDLVHVAETEAG